MDMKRLLLLVAKSRKTAEKGQIVEEPRCSFCGTDMPPAPAPGRSQRTVYQRDAAFAELGRWL